MWLRVLALGKVRSSAVVPGPGAAVIQFQKVGEEMLPFMARCRRSMCF